MELFGWLMAFASLWIKKNRDNLRKITQGAFKLVIKIRPCFCKIYWFYNLWWLWMILMTITQNWLINMGHLCSDCITSALKLLRIRYLIFFFISSWLILNATNLRAWCDWFHQQYWKHFRTCVQIGQRNSPSLCFIFQWCLYRVYRW